MTFEPYKVCKAFFVSLVFYLRAFPGWHATVFPITLISGRWFLYSLLMLTEGVCAFF